MRHLKRVIFGPQGQVAAFDDQGHQVYEQQQPTIYRALSEMDRQGVLRPDTELEIVEPGCGKWGSWHWPEFQESNATWLAGWAAEAYEMEQVNGGHLHETHIPSICDANQKRLQEDLDAALQALDTICLLCLEARPLLPSAGALRNRVLRVEELAWEAHCRIAGGAPLEVPTKREE